MPYSTPFQLRQRRERGLPTRLGRHILLKKANVMSFVFHRTRRPAGASAAGWRCPPERAHRPQLAYAGTCMNRWHVLTPLPGRETPRAANASVGVCTATRAIRRRRGRQTRRREPRPASPPSRSRRAPTQARLDLPAGSVVFRILFLKAREPVLGAVGGPEHQRPVILCKIAEVHTAFASPTGGGALIGSLHVVAVQVGRAVDVA